MDNLTAKAFSKGESQGITVNAGKKRQLLGNVVVMLIALSVCAVIVESLTRLIYDDVVLFNRHTETVTYGPFTVRRLERNATFYHESKDGRWRFDTNAQGYRDVNDFSYEKSEGEIRVISLGDSHTLGHEIRQDFTYSAFLERMLRRNGGKGRVMNTGIAGFGTAEQLIFLKHEGIKYDPDVVVLGFYGNDFDDNVRSNIFRLADGKLHTSNTNYAPGAKALMFHNSIPPLRWMSENSHFYSLIMNAVWEGVKGLMLSREKADLLKEHAVSDNVENIVTAKIDLAKALIVEMYRFCRENGIKLVIIDIPRFRPNRYEAVTSVPDRLEVFFTENSDVFRHTSDVLAPYENVVAPFVPNGQRHISELAHFLYASNIFQSSVIQEAIQNKNKYARISAH